MHGIRKRKSLDFLDKTLALVYTQFVFMFLCV